MRHTTLEPTVMVLLAITGSSITSSCGSEELRPQPEERFSPLSGEERHARELIVQHIDAAESLLNDGRLTREQSDQLEAAVAHARASLAEFMRQREKGYNRGVVMMSLGSASTGVAGNNVTVVGVADDWLLVPIAIAALSAHLFMAGPASRTELDRAWLAVGNSMSLLGQTVESISQALNHNTSQAGIKPRPVSRPATKTKTTIDVSPPVPQSVPAAREAPRRRREECQPKPRCPHIGKDDWHNECADVVLENEYPGCDVSIKNRAFDALRGNTLYEVKTHDWDTYAEFITNEELKNFVKLVKRDIAIARACGYRYEFVVGDAKLADDLSKRLAPVNVVRHEQKCNRKDYKARQAKKAGKSRKK